MTEEERDHPPTGRESPVGSPVIRGDPSLTGDRADEAIEFDPDESESLERAAATVAAFEANTAGASDNVFMLRGAAACATLVRGEGSYKAAAARAGDDVTVSFIRKWSRVHDLPEAIRRHVVTGEIPPTAAKHVARVAGTARLHLAWAILDGEMTVRQVRSVASDVNDGVPLEEALTKQGVALGEITLELATEPYCELRRQASLTGREPSEVVEEALESAFSEE